jgi:hypothetical protein
MQDARFVLPSNEVAPPSVQRFLSGDKLPFSPISIIDPIRGGRDEAFQKQPKKSKIDLGGDYGDGHHYHRTLGGDNQQQSSSYLVDSSGKEYEPYSLAWRYLGMYIDCDYEPSSGYSGGSDGGDGGYYNRRRTTRTRMRRRTTAADDEPSQEEEEEEQQQQQQQRSLGGSGSGDGDGCERVLLWAAYHDPKYKGGSIGEYKYYDWTTGEWDESHCHTKRCVRMDCHEPNTRNWKLVGVFKESDGLVDWAEQLFKHEGYCIWDEDTYEVMQSQREEWPSECIKLYYSDSSGNTLYHHLQPQAEGNITLGIYTDEDCTQVSSTTSFFDYIVIWYTNYYYGTSAQAEKAISYWNSTITSWNEYMTPYKICQPCRAYSLNNDEDDEEEGSHSGSGDHRDRDLRDRDLRRLENEGEGDAEQWGYDCEDAAGYTNCNQVRFFVVGSSILVYISTKKQETRKEGRVLLWLLFRYLLPVLTYVLRLFDPYALTTVLQIRNQD